MRVLVTGSRRLDPMFANFVARTVMFALRDALIKSDDVTLVHGGAEGVDAWAKQGAVHLCRDMMVVELEEYRPDYKGAANPRAAPILRNGAMVDTLDTERGDHVLAFWDGESKGTLSTIGFAQKRGIPVILYTLRKETL